MRIEISKIRNVHELLEKSKWLEGKSLAEIQEDIKNSDKTSRVVTKGNVGYVIERGFFGITMNSDARPDIEHLGVEIKTCPLKYNKSRTRLSVKEPLSLNIINYHKEASSNGIEESSIYKKNNRILFVFYIHDSEKPRSEYVIKYVFLWEMDKEVTDELNPDYMKIIDKIRDGRAHEIHQSEHRFLTICPKHGGVFKNPDCKKSKTTQPASEELAEIRAFRLKNRYMDLIISRHLGKELGKGGWLVD